jgi:primosomal replication protein N
MTITPSTFTMTTPERFDANQVELVGLVTKIWARSSGDVFARLSLGEPPLPEDADPQGRACDPRMTVLLPGGQVNGRDISLQKGDALLIEGFLSDMTLWESLGDFLLKARQAGLYERIPELAPAMGVQVKRIATCVIPEALEVLDPQKREVKPHSNARLEGVVARVWVYGGHLFARLAVYDVHTQLAGQMGNHGRQRRIPHYLTVQFSNEQVDGRSVSLKPRDRIRVVGQLGARVYSENLRTFLISARKADLLAHLSDGQAPDVVWTAYVQTCLVAQQMIQYTRR